MEAIPTELVREVKPGMMTPDMVNKEPDHQHNKGVRKMKKWLQRIIQTIADANEREYGDSVPDCCAKGKTEAKAPRK